jgi:transposase
MGICKFSHLEKLTKLLNNLRMKKLFSNRNTRKAATFQLRVSDKKGSELTETARSNLMIEHAHVKSKQITGTLTELYAHYGINKNTFCLLKKKWQARGHLGSKERPGRPSLWDEKAEQELRDATRANRKATPKQLRYVVKGSTGGGNYRGKKKEHVSAETVRVWKIQAGYKLVSIKPRPKITPQNAVERKIYATKLVKVKDLEHTRLKVDEKWFTVPGLTGKLSYHEDSDDEDEEQYPSQGHKRHPPQIMVIAGVTKPVLKEGWTTEDDKWEKDGKVFIARVQRNKHVERGKKKKGRNGQVLRGPRGPRGGKGPELYEYKVGDLRPADVLSKETGGLDGKLYANMWNGTGDAIGTGLLEQAENYGGVKIIQEDGAPGHGYSNKKEGKPPTAEHDRFTTEAEAKGMKVERQSANSPELNELDLGVWFALDAAKERRYKEFLPRMNKEELLDKLWECIFDEWKNLSPETLFSIAEHKVDVAECVIANNGAKMNKEPHGNARKRTKLAIEAACAQSA